MALEVASSILVARPIYLTVWGVAKWLRHRILIPAFVGSNPATPATYVATIQLSVWPISSVGRAPDF